MLLSLIMFGSRARGDQRLTSDVDLLGVVESGAIRETVSTRGASFYQYPFDILKSKSSSGDLFLLHLISEGRILHDTVGAFRSVCGAFEYKSTYEREILEASAIIWFLGSHARNSATRQTKKRVIWALRTILIARAAERKIPVFSSSGLAEFARLPDLKNVIDKRFTIPWDMLLRSANEVCERFGVSRTGVDWPDSRAEQEACLRALGGVAKATIDDRKRSRRVRVAENHPDLIGYL